MSKVIGSLDANAVSLSNQGISKTSNHGAAKPEKTVAADKKDKKTEPSAIVSLNHANSSTTELYTAAGVTQKAVQPVQAPAPAKAATSAVTSKPAEPAKANNEAQKNTDNSEGIQAGTGPVVVDIQQSDSGYNNKIYYSTDNFATKHLIGIDNNVASVNLGTFEPGTKIQFAIDNGQGNFFKAGSASQNADGVQHANITNNSDGVTIGFEDLWGGGDKDFNDAIIRVHTTSAPPPSPQPQVVTPPAPQPETPPVAKKPETKDNRSGLGDGTNPGKGTGTENSPNTGTVNPGNNTGTAKPVATDKPAKANETAKAEKPAKPQETDKSDNRSGLGDGTNPGKGAGTDNSLNTGTLNPGIDSGKTGTSAAKQSKAATSDNSNNRSGLGDGTNPGQGAGRTNATNQGTLNPSQAAKKTSQVV